MEKITEALSKLDPMNVEHWTEDGAPSLEAVIAISGESKKTVTREAIMKIAPDFNRAKAMEGKLVSETKPEVAETKTEVSTDVMMEHLAEAQAKLVRMDEDLAELTAERNAFVAEVDNLAAKINSGPTQSHAELMQDYFAKQDAVRAEENERREKLKELGLLQGMSPSELDKALSGRKRNVPAQPASEA